MSSRAVLRVAVAALALAGLASNGLAQQGDPFYTPPKAKAATKPKAAPSKSATLAVAAAPSFEERAARCRNSSSSGMTSAEASPCPYLVSELKVLGIFSGPDGDGAFVQAKGTNQTFVVKPGDTLYDGRVDSVRQASGTSSAAVIFTQTKRVKDGKATREITMQVTSEAAS